MRKLLTIALAATSFTLSACGGKDATGPVDLTGTYTLQTIGGVPVPTTTEEDSTHKEETLSSTISLAADKTYSWANTFRSTDNGVVTTNTATSAGTYTVSGSTLTLKDEQGSADATLSSNTITFALRLYGLSIPWLVYKR